MFSANKEKRLQFLDRSLYDSFYYDNSQIILLGDNILRISLSDKNVSLEIQ